MYKKVKTELFFLYKLFNPKYTPVCAGDVKCYVDYFRNRFGGAGLFDKFPGYKFESKDDFELHFLCQENDVWMLTWCLYSFLYFSKLMPKAIVIHDDGSIKAETAGKLEKKFSNLKVIRRAYANRTVLEKLSGRGKIYEYRKNGYPLNMKLIDSVLLDQGAAKIMVMDSDILFFREPKEIVSLIRDKNKKEALLWGQSEKAYDMSIVKKDYLAKYGILNNGAEYIQGSLNIFDNGAITLEKMGEYYNNCTAETGFYFVEASGWVSLLGQLNFRLLQLDAYRVKGRVDDKTVAKHYTSGRRQELYAHGIGLVKSKIK